MGIFVRIFVMIFVMLFSDIKSRPREKVFGKSYHLENSLRVNFPGRPILIQLPPSLINIFGVIVFLRSGWIVAEAGIASSSLIVLGEQVLL